MSGGVQEVKLTTSFFLGYLQSPVLRWRLSPLRIFVSSVVKSFSAKQLINRELHIVVKTSDCASESSTNIFPQEQQSFKSFSIFLVDTRTVGALQPYETASK